jgi:hypothetical protein
MNHHDYDIPQRTVEEQGHADHLAERISQLGGGRIRRGPDAERVGAIAGEAIRRRSYIGAVLQAKSAVAYSGLPASGAKLSSVVLPQPRQQRHRMLIHRDNQHEN